MSTALVVAGKVGLLRALGKGVWKLTTSKAARLALARWILDSVEAHEPKPEAKPIPPPQLFPVLVALVLGASVSGCALVKRLGGDDCLKLRVAEELACGAEPSSAECRDARALLAERCGDQPPPVTPPTTTPPATTPPEPRHLCPATLCPPGRPLCRETPAGPECYAEPEPEPPAVDPAACPAVVVDAIQHGRRQYRGGPHGPQCLDSTPRVCGDEAVSVAVGRPGQYCVPLGPECPEDSPEPCWRTTCEELFNGGPTPRWMVVDGDIRGLEELAWGPCPRGVGHVKVCDRDLRTCSDPIAINRP